MGVEGGGHNHTAPSIAQSGNSLRPAKEGDVGCAEEANTRSPLPPSRAGGGGEGKASSGMFKRYYSSFW